MKLKNEVYLSILMLLVQLIQQTQAVTIPIDSDVLVLKAEIHPDVSTKTKPDVIKQITAERKGSAITKTYLATKDDIPEECSKEFYNIRNSNELSALENCEVVSGSILITDYHEPIVDLGSIGSVRGSLIIKNVSSLQKIQGDGLQSISGKMKFQELTSLTSIRFPSLTSVNHIDWQVLPILNSVGFDTGIKNVESIVVADTSLTGFSGFDVDSLKILNINNNRYLDSINSQVKKITEELSIAANAQNAIVNLPSLAWANNITFRDISSLDITSLEEVEATIGFIDNNIEVLKVPKLRNIGGTLIIAENKDLKQIEFPNLQEVDGGLMIVDNPHVAKVNFFPKLHAIGGAIKFNGSFQDLSLPKLRLVKGSASLKTTSNLFNCGRWIRSEASAFVRGGKIECSADAKSSETIHVDNNGMITGSVTTNDSDRNTQTSGSTRIRGISLATMLSASILTVFAFY